MVHVPVCSQLISKNILFHIFSSTTDSFFNTVNINASVVLLAETL